MFLIVFFVLIFGLVLNSFCTLLNCYWEMYVFFISYVVSCKVANYDSFIEEFLSLLNFV